MKPKLKPKKDKPDQVVSFRIDAKTLQTVQDLAVAKDRTVAYVLRELVSIGLTS